MRALVHITVFLSLAISSALAIAATPLGGQPTPPPTPEPTATRTATPTQAPLTVHIPISSDPPTISWTQVPGAATYAITGTLIVIRVNAADAFCQPPLSPDSRTLELGETVAGDISQFDLPLPALPPADEWFFATADVTVSALDGTGQVLASGGGSGIAETNVECATPTVQLPSTGLGRDAPDSEANDSLLLLAAVAAMALGAITLTAIVLRRRLPH